MCAPSEKDKRYDRQLRLWGNHGQSALESAHVCLLNATATGTEILKNLILPGVGSFTIVDNAKITANDPGNNFFITLGLLGQSRAEIAVRMLLQLNDTKGNYIDEDVEEVLGRNPNFFSQFTVVIACGLPHKTLARVSALLLKSSIPLLVARTYGLVGFIRIALDQHEVVESHPDYYHEDLRIDSPFQRLMKYMDSVDLDALDDTNHSNVPFLVILYKYLLEWKKSHKGDLPKTFHEKTEFKKMIQSGRRRNKEGVPLDEENFDEAIQNVNRLVIPYRLPSSVQDILNNPLCTSITPDSNNFWLLTRALREFVANEGHGKLPLRGSIPDMTSSSDAYMRLCRVYQAQAREDIEAVASHLGQILISIGKAANYISEDDIKLFCRNSAFLRVLKYRSIVEEMEMPDRSTLGLALENPESDLVYYVLLCAAEQFYAMYRVYPGLDEGVLEVDIVRMKSIVANLLTKWQLTVSICDDHVSEFCRYGAGEIHSVAAFVGGIAAQEAIKIITQQFIPLNNTIIYNAATSSTTSVII